MSVILTYGGVNPFSNQPIPFVGRTKENIYYGERWASVERISLLGQLTGCEFSDLYSAQQSLISGFSKSFQTLVIDTGSFDNIIVNSINFPSANYVKVLPYQIELSHYPRSFFSGFFGVVDPLDSWSYNQGEDGLVEITHEISARGLQTASGALDSAKNFVLSRTGFSSYIAPQFIQRIGASGILKSQSEKINRFDASYSITETYTSDQFYPSEYGVLRYTIEQGLNQAGFNSASIQGSFQGGINDDFSIIKSRANGFDYYSELINGISSGNTVNTYPLSKKITENQYLRKIDFSLTYDDNPNGQTNVDYTVNINSGIDRISVAVNGQVNGRGDLKDRWEIVQSEFSSLDIYDIASTAFTAYAGGTLNPNAKAESVTKDLFNGTVSFDYSYEDSPAPSSSDLMEFNYEINVKPPLRKITASPLILKAIGSTYSKYEVTDIGFDNRGQLSINGNSIPQRATSSAAAEAATTSALAGLFATYSNGYKNIYLERYDLNSANSESFNFNSEWTFEGNGVIAGTNYSTINSL